MPLLGGFQLANAELGAPTAPSYPTKNITAVAKITGTTARTITGLGNIWILGTPVTTRQTLFGKAWIGNPIIIEQPTGYVQVALPFPSQSVTRSMGTVDTLAVLAPFAGGYLIPTYAAWVSTSISFTIPGPLVVDYSTLTSASITFSGGSATIVYPTFVAPRATFTISSSAVLVLDTATSGW